MVRRSIGVVAALCACCAAQTADPLLTAICKKPLADLHQLVETFKTRGGSAGDSALEVPEGADHDTVAKAVYMQAQKEKPGGEVKEWPGCGDIKPAAASKATAGGGSPSSGKETWQQMAEMLFKSQDKDGDGKLSREELAKMIASTNAAAKKQGLAEADFFKGVDTNQDDVADRAEIEAYFKAQMGSAGATGGAGAAKARPKASSTGQPGGMDPASMHETMFKSLDKNGDGKLSKGARPSSAPLVSDALSLSRASCSCACASYASAVASPATLPMFTYCVCVALQTRCER